MKFAALLAILSLVLTFQVAYATEETVSESENIAAYCDEQAELSGIEDAGEKAKYIQDCVDSFAVPSADSQ